MSKILIDVMKQALEYLQDNQHLIADNERHAYVMEYNAFIERFEQAIADAEKQQALDKMADNARELGLTYEPEHCEAGPEYCPECKTEAEKTAFAFGWYKALESVREQQEPVAEVKAKMTGGNVGIATVIHEIRSPLREPLQPGDKLYAAYRWIGWDVEQVWSERIFGIDMRFENVLDAIAFRKKLDEATNPQAQPAQEPDPDELTIAYMSGVYEGKTRKPWVGLTDEERRACTQSPFTADNYLAIEAKLKEKNT